MQDMRKYKMTELVAATQNFNYDFEYSFQNFVDVAGGIQWNPKFQKHIDNGIDWSLIAKAKLIIFTGGEDISPAIYGHENEYSYVNFERDKIELSILKYSLSLNKKILGVCRGHQ